jgi:VWFA-related protein
MRKEFAVLLSAAIACITPAVAQEAPRVGTPHFQSGTRMVLVPVVVRDPQGRTVSDLSRESFQLFDKGREQPIAAFSVERSESAGAAPSTSAPAQFIAYFFDDLLLDFGKLREAAIHQLVNLRPDDRVAIFSSSCRLALDFTGDRAKLQDVIAKLGPATAPVCQLSPLVPLRIALLKAVVSRMAHLPGTKRIVVVSPGLAVAHADQEAWESLIDQAAEAKVTIDSLHVAQEIQSAMAGSTREVGHDAAENMHRVPNFQKLDDRATRVDAGNLNILADGTGGAVVKAGNAPEAGLRALATPDCVYMLGFAPAKADEGYHKLKVTLMDARKLSVRARAGYYSTVALSTNVTADVTAEVTAPEPPEKRVSAAEVLPPDLPPGAGAPVKPAVEAPEIDTREPAGDIPRAHQSGDGAGSGAEWERAGGRRPAQERLPVVGPRPAAGNRELQRAEDGTAGSARESLRSGACRQRRNFGAEDIAASANARSLHRVRFRRRAYALRRPVPSAGGSLAIHPGFGGTVGPNCGGDNVPQGLYGLHGRPGYAARGAFQNYGHGDVSLGLPSLRRLELLPRK